MPTKLTGALRHGKAHRTAVTRSAHAKAWRPPYAPDALQSDLDHLLALQREKYGIMAQAFPVGSAAQRAAAVTAQLSREAGSPFDPYPLPIKPDEELNNRAARRIFDILRFRWAA
jgi:hypothetical protein